MRFKRLILVFALFSVLSWGFSSVFADNHAKEESLKCDSKEVGECTKTCEKKCDKDCAKKCGSGCSEAKKCESGSKSCCKAGTKCEEGEAKCCKKSDKQGGSCLKVKKCCHNHDHGGCSDKQALCEKNKAKCSDSASKCDKAAKECDKGKGKAAKSGCPYHGQEVAQANLESNEGDAVKKHCDKGKGLKRAGCAVKAVKAGCCPRAKTACKSNKAVSDNSGSAVSKDRAIYNLNFTLKDHKGNKVTLADNAGKIVVLEWLNYDCPFDKPHYQSGDMQKLAEKWSDNGVVWLTVNSTHYSDAKSNSKFAEKYDVSVPILIDSDGSVGKKFGARTTPHIFILGKDGNLVYRGAFDNAPRGKVQGDEYINYVDKVLTDLAAGNEIAYSYVKPYGCSVKYAK